MNSFHVLIAVASVFVVGSVVGSFLNVCIYRIPRGLSLVRPPSRCPRCLVAVAARDNLPLLGWLLLRGRCRSCRLPIPARYPLVEALTGALFAGAVGAAFAGARDPFEAGPWAAGVRWVHDLMFVAAGVTCGFIAWDEGRVGARLPALAALAGVGLAASGAPGLPSLADSMAGGFAGLAAAGALAVVGRSGPGGGRFGPGELALAAMTGAYLGPPGALAAVAVAAVAGRAARPASYGPPPAAILSAVALVVMIVAACR